MNSILSVVFLFLVIFQFFIQPIMSFQNFLLSQRTILRRFSTPSSHQIPHKLDSKARELLLPSLKSNHWHLQSNRDAIQKTYHFTNFIQAFGFMSACALEAEKLNHHPEWFNVYNKVEVVLSTHDCQGLSSLDIDLAHKMDRLAANFLDNHHQDTHKPHVTVDRNE